MLQQKLLSLKDFILRYNPYFKKGFDSVFQDDETGIINDNNEPVFPSDTFGNYFYMRLPNDLLPDYSQEYKISDAQNSIGVKYNVILVACVHGADSSLLLENLITTIGRYQPDNVKITKMIYQMETIVMQELSKVKDKENIASALQRFPNDMAIACVHFTFTIPFVFQALNCIQNPCKSC